MGAVVPKAKPFNRRSRDEGPRDRGSRH